MAKSKDCFLINSLPSMRAFFVEVERQFNQHHYLTYNAPRIGVDRSLDQSALFHVWCTEFAAYLTPCDKKEVNAGMLDGIKLTVKGLFYREYPYDWMVHKVVCPLTKRERLDHTSSASWKTGEMFLVLTFLQNFAETQGCILESIGKFKKLQMKQNQ